MRRSTARLAIALALSGAAGCVSVSTPRFLMSAPQRDWKETFERAQALAEQGLPAQADSILADYARAYPVSPGARETLYWRALIQLRSGMVSPNGPAMLLNQYIAGPEADHPIEAAVLLRVAVRVDSLSRAANALATRIQTSNGEVSAANNRAADAKSDARSAAADNKDQDAEIKRLRGELAAAREELERIKKRLAEPAKKPPDKPPA